MLGLAYALVSARIEAQPTILEASADTYLKSGSPNQAVGSDTLLRIQSSGNNRALVRFDPVAISAAIGSGSLASARLQLYIQSNSNNWGTDGQPVDALRLTADWSEAGATWNCGIDTIPTNSQANCSSQWAGGTFNDEPSDTILHTNGLSGWISFDVTADVQAFLAGTPNYGWMVKKADESQSGQVDYTSRQGTSNQHPKLVLVVESPTSDAVPPKLAIVSPTLPYVVNNATPPISVQYSDGGSGVDVNSLDVQVDGASLRASCAVTAATATCTPPVLASGVHIVHATVRDHLGNSASADLNFNLLIGSGYYTATFSAKGDSYLLQGSPNQAVGGASFLEVRESGHHRVVAQFDAQALSSTLAGATLRSATLELYLQSNGKNWGTMGRMVEAHRVTVPWQESAVTWNCAADTNLTNSQPDCGAQWSGGSLLTSPTASVLHTNSLQGWVQYDVTVDVAAFLTGAPNYGWLLKKSDEGTSGKADYTSREGTAGQGPQLVLVFEIPSSQDTDPPAIFDLSPANGVVLVTSVPSISAAFADAGSGVDPVSVRLLVDGADRTAQTQVSATGVVLTTSSPLAEGVHAISVSVKDHAGNAAQATWSFTTDTIPPAVTIAAPQPGGYLAVPVIAATFSDAGSGLDIASARVTIDGISVSANAVSSDSGIVAAIGNSFADGGHTLVVSVRDHAGNEGRSSVAFVLDTVPPAVTITAPGSAIVTGNPRPQIAATLSDATAGIDSGSVAILLDDVDIKSACTVTVAALTCVPSPLVAGLHHLRVSLADRAGNPSVADTTFQLVLDLQPPVITIASPVQDSATREATILVAGTVTDDGTVTGVLLGGSAVPFTNGSFSGSANLVEGSNRLVVTATDATGKTSVSAVTVTRDTTAPVLKVDSPHSGQLTNQADITVEGTARDETGVAVQVNSQPVTLQDGQFKQSLALQEGTNTLTVVATDGVGNQTQQEVIVSRFSLPAVQITSPVDLSYISSTTTTVSGTLSSPTATVTVNGKPAAVSGGSFAVADVPLVEGGNTLTATATDSQGHVATHSVNVVRDLEPPHVRIYTPQDGSVVSDSTVTVAGLVNDIVAGTVNASEATVTVNGRSAIVANRSFSVEGVPLAVGDNVLTAQAVDASGNRAETSVTVRRLETTGPRLSLVSGNNQSGTIGTVLPQALVVGAVGVSGQPMVGQTVLFRVRSGSGTLAGGKRQIAVTTGADGHAATSFTLGTRAGAAAQLVDAEAVGFAGPATFTESALPADPALIVVDSGDQQLGVTGQVLPRPLVAAVTDRGYNRLGRVPVSFSVVQGGGHFEDGSRERTVLTDSDGRAIVTFVAGPEEGTGNNVVEARIVSLPQGSLAGFTATVWAAGDPAATAIHGVVLDNSNQPVPGVTLRVRDTAIVTQSDAQGLFRISPTPVGRVKLIVDGSTAQRPGSWPDLEFELTTIAGRDNDLGMPIYLLPLDIAHGLLVDETHGGTLTLQDLPGFSLEIQAGSVTFPGGSKSGVVSVTIVHSDKVPMVPNFGQQPRFIVTIQPAGARFDPPARMSLPNVDGLAPGEVTEFYSFDHDLGHFVSIGPATVSDDGTMIVSNPGVGILKAGWHCGGNPGLTGTPHDCPICSECVGDYCFADDSQTPPQDPERPCIQFVCSGGAPLPRNNDNAIPPQRSAHDCLKQVCKSGSVVDQDNFTETPEQTLGNCQEEICGPPFQLALPSDRPPGKACCEGPGQDPIGFPQSTPYNPSTECCTPKGVIPKEPPILDLSACPNRTQSDRPNSIDGCSLGHASDIAEVIAHYPFLDYSGDRNNPAGGRDTTFGSLDAAQSLPCNDHDKCYQTCTTASELSAYSQCNQQMFADMLTICDASKETTSVRENCYAWALMYQGFLTAAGDVFFHDDQKNWCKCCQ